MTHYVTYHNTEKMDFSFRERDGEPNPTSFAIVTKKRLRDAEGSIVWLVSGEGNPRDFRLEEWFEVERFVAIEPQGTHQADGTRGVAFRPGGIPLRQFAWFETLFKSMSHFSLGTQKLSNEQVRWFCEAASREGFDLPPGIQSASMSELLPGQTDLPQGGALRRTIEIDRIIRDSAVSLQVKRLHACQCQVCGLALEAPDGFYAEGAHIRPLGEPHNGADVPGNILCLCPNHHVLLDRGAFSVADSLELIGLEGGLRKVAGHEVDAANFAYHRRLWMPATEA